MKFLITGDIHGNPARFEHGDYDADTAIIILGDAGCNYYLDKRDKELKEKLNNIGCRFYLVRGNHEARPEDVQGIKLEYDDEVQGFVYVEPAFPNIRYFKDGDDYVINGFQTLVIGGAYSVDKFYRLKKGWRWFENEQLNKEEMEHITNWVIGSNYDLVLTHTCPLDWEPTDLFIGGIDQSTVDTSMEVWMNKLKDIFFWKVWLFGHFHTDRKVKRGVELCYWRIESLEDIMERNLFDFS